MIRPSVDFAGRAAPLKTSNGAKMLRCIFADALEQVEAFVRDLPHEALVDQPLNDIDQRRGVGSCLHADNGARGLEREPALEDRQTGERTFLCLAEEFP